MGSSPIRVVVVGAAGKMGSQVLSSLSGLSDIEIVAAVDRTPGQLTTDVAGPKAVSLPIESKLGEVLDRIPADVTVDFTHAAACPDHTLIAIKRGVSPVIGTSGLSPNDVSAIRSACDESGVPAMIVPNFAIGAILMMRFASIAAAWMPDAEIIEYHHRDKADAPSGTAFQTAERIAEARRDHPRFNFSATQKVEGARGAKIKDVHVHSVRLPGLVAHQEVLFGGTAEVLSLRHDATDRRSYMEGVKLAVRNVRSLKGLVIGLENLVFRD